jgi:SagB-type dehydrogenase family enzyme
MEFLMFHHRGREYKTAPSAGATFPLEIYLLVGNVDGVEPGLYRYLPDTHSLKSEKSGDMRKAVKNACLGQKHA